MKKITVFVLIGIYSSGSLASECIADNEIPAFRQLLTEANDRIAGTAGELVASKSKVKSLSEELESAKKELEALKKKPEPK